MGDTIPFKVTICQPNPSTVLYCEIYTPYDDDGAIFSLCPPRLTHIGSNLKDDKDQQITTSSIPVTMEAWNTNGPKAYMVSEQL